MCIAAFFNFLFFTYIWKTNVYRIYYLSVCLSIYLSKDIQIYRNNIHWYADSVQFIFLLSACSLANY